MAKYKFYVVKTGRKPGIYEDWSECLEQINGYSGAVYKGFVSRDEAEIFYSTCGDSLENKQRKKEEQDCSEDADNNYFSIKAYVDGSFNLELNRYSFGCVILTPNGETIKESGSNNEPDSVQLRNVAGEMIGAMYAVKYAINNGYKSIELYYDYEGIEKWATNEWKAKTVLTKKYAVFMKESQEIIQIHFIKVAAHTGDKYNEMADRLAKEALKNKAGIPKVRKGDYWFTVDSFSSEDLKAIIDIVIEELGNDNIQYSNEEKSVETIHSLKLLPKEKVMIHLYSNGKLVIQGKPKKLFATIVSLITELVETDRIPEIFNGVYSLDIDKNNVETEFHTYLPNAHNRLPSKLSKTLHQAVYNLNITGDVYDATFLAQPVIRAIDGHLKNVLITYNVIRDAKEVRNGYFMFDKVREEKYSLRKKCITGEMNNQIVDYLGRCYSFYHRNRNVLSHWDDPNQGIDTTKLLNVQEAHDLIKKTLNLINEFYEII